MADADRAIAGADRSIANARGDLPVTLAATQGHQAVARQAVMGFAMFCPMFSPVPG